MDVCRMCGLPFGSRSFGGPGICPACDCGIPPSTSQANAKLWEVERERDSLRATLATQAATIERLKMELKRHAPISHYDGRDIESWMQEAKTLRKDAAYCQEHHTLKQLCDEQDKTIEGLRKQIKELEEYKFMYEGLCK